MKNQLFVEKMSLHQKFLNKLPEGKKAIFDGEDFSNMKLNCYSLEKVIFKGTIMKHVILDNSSLQHTRFTYRTIVRKPLIGSNVPLSRKFPEEIKVHVDLSGSSIRESNLESNDLSDINLSKVDFSFSNLRYCDFHNSDLSFAKLVNCDMTGANLNHSNLSNADLSNAILENVSLIGTKLENIVFSQSTIWPKDFNPNTDI